MKPEGSTNEIGSVAKFEAEHARVASGQRKLLATIPGCERDEVWHSDGYRDLPHWLSARADISVWEARRWIHAAHTLPQLPRLSAALESGLLGLNKVVELCRFATPETEEQLVKWAKKVSAWAIRRKADLANARSIEDTKADDKERYLNHWWLDDGRLALEGLLPADQGAVVATALDGLAGRMPDIVTEDDEELHFEVALDMRRADALVALASRAIAEDQDADRATVIVHAPLEALLTDESGCEIEHGPVIHPEVARRLCCDARLQTILNGKDGNPVGIGRTSRNVPRWLRRLLRRRDRGCTFPGCQARWFLHAHHIQNGMLKASHFRPGVRFPSQAGP
jgi:hypothetical protein